MAKGGEMVGDGEIWAKLSKFIIVELSCIVQGDNFRNLESVDNVFPYKFFDIYFYDFGKKFCFYRLGKVINGDNQKFSL